MYVVARAGPKQPSETQEAPSFSGRDLFFQMAMSRASSFDAAQSFCGDDSEWQEDLMCHACLDFGPPSEVRVRYDGKFFHCPCWAGVRSYNRTLVTKEEKDANQTQFKTDPDAWRANVKPFLTPSRADRQQAREQAKQTRHVSKTSVQSFDTNESINDKLRVNKTQFTAFKGFWERWSDAKCSDEFDALHKRQRGEHDVPELEGEEFVLIDDIARVRAASGTKRSRGAEEHEDIDEHDFVKSRVGLRAVRRGLM